jgi:hypothetical protein
MNVQALIEELKGLDVELRAVGDDLEYEGPEAAVTLELLERLKAHKAELMAVCGKRETVAEEGRQPGEFVWLRTAVDPESTRKLVAARWESKERCGKTIWKHPDSGFYYSQELALHFLDRGAGSVRCKSGADRKG